MYIFLRNNDYRYAAEQMLLMLFPEERPGDPSADPGLPTPVSGRRMLSSWS